MTRRGVLDAERRGKGIICARIQGRGAFKTGKWVPPEVRDLERKEGAGMILQYTVVTWPLSIGNRAFRKGGKSRGVPDQERRGQRTGALCGEDQLRIYTVLIITKPLTEENNLRSGKGVKGRGVPDQERRGQRTEAFGTLGRGASTEDRGIW